MKIKQEKNQSTTIRQIKKIVDDYDAKLLATDKRFNKSVHIIHEEGTILHFENAFLMKITSNENVWIIIFTEHHDTHIYHESDLYSYYEYKRIYKPPEELKL